MDTKKIFKQNRLALLGAIATTLCGLTVSAVPTLYPDKVTQLSSIKNETDSNLVMDSVDPKRVYVMPPNTAVAKVKGLHTINANIGFCSQIKDAKDYAGQLQSRMKTLSTQEFEQVEEIEKYQKVLADARTSAAAFATSKDMSAILDLDSAIESTDLRLKDLYAHLDKCKTGCEAATAEANSLQKQKVDLVKDRRALARQKAADVREYDRRKSAIDAARENLDEKSVQYEKLQRRAAAIREDFLNIYRAFGKMEGARAALSYTSNWQNNIDKLRADNAGFSFESIQTSDVTVFASLLNVKDIPADRAILAYEMPGKQTEGAIQLNNYPPKLDANIVLSLLGACPMLYPQDYVTAVSTDPGEMKYGLVVTYNYPSSFMLKVTATYNMYKMYQKIVSSGSKGGFFKSRSWSKVEEHNFFKDSFSVNWEEQDPSNSLTEDRRLEVEKELRAQIFERIATKVMTVSQQGDVIAAAKPGPHGATVLADSLTKTCPANVYCQGASIALNVLDAIFGSGSSSANYTRIQNIDSKDTWSREKVTDKPWITTYSP